MLVYNIHAGMDAAGADNIARVAALVRESGADVALLQEVDRGVRRSRGVDQPAELARLTGMQAAFGKTLDFQGGDYGIAILSRWPIDGDSLVRLVVEPPQPRSEGRTEPRGALHATLRSPWGPLEVVNTHIDASRDDRWRRQEMPQVVALATRLLARGGTVLAGGDLNSEPASEVQAMASRAGLRDAWAECGRGDGLTFPADTPVKRIDYLYLLGALGCAEATVLPGAASDHRALLVRVRRR